MTNLSKTNLVFILLKEPLQIIPLDSLSHVITVDGNEYTRKSEGDFNGFYDWLRNSNGKIIGLRYFLFEDVRFLIEPLRTLTYVKLKVTDWENAVASLRFYETFEVDEGLSRDQLFGDNSVYRSENDTYGVSFFLPEGELPFEDG